MKTKRIVTLELAGMLFLGSCPETVVARSGNGDGLCGVE